MTASWLIWKERGFRDTGEPTGFLEIEILLP
jgi:hypothetical protein